MEEASSTRIAEDAERLHHADHVGQTYQSSELLLTLDCEQAQGNPEMKYIDRALEADSFKCRDRIIKSR